MQRLALLVLALAAACGGGGPDTGPATLSGVEVKGAAAETFTGPDGAGNTVLGWNILLFKDDAGSDCMSGTVLAKVAIYTQMTEADGEEALLEEGGISIVTEAPPTLIANTAANMTAMGVDGIVGLVEITDFHLKDRMHADKITGTISAGGTSAGSDVSLTGDFEAPVCE
jgi:hypothetical protein